MQSQEYAPTAHRQRRARRRHIETEPLDSEQVAAMQSRTEKLGDNVTRLLIEIDEVLGD